MALNVSRGSTVRPTQTGPGLIQPFKPATPVINQAAGSVGNSISRMGKAFSAIADQKRIQAQNDATMTATQALRASLAERRGKLMSDRTNSEQWGALMNRDSPEDVDAALAPLKEAYGHTDHYKEVEKRANLMAKMAGINIEQSSLVYRDASIKTNAGNFLKIAVGQALDAGRGTPDYNAAIKEVNDYVKPLNLMQADKDLLINSFMHDVDYGHAVQYAKTKGGAEYIVEASDKDLFDGFYKWIDKGTERQAIRTAAANTLNVGKDKVGAHTSRLLQVIGFSIDTMNQAVVGDSNLDTFQAALDQALQAKEDYLKLKPLGDVKMLRMVDGPIRAAYDALDKKEELDGAQTLDDIAVIERSIEKLAKDDEGLFFGQSNFPAQLKQHANMMRGRIVLDEFLKPDGDPTLYQPGSKEYGYMIEYAHGRKVHEVPDGKGGTMHVSTSEAAMRDWDKYGKLLIADVRTFGLSRQAYETIMGRSTSGKDGVTEAAAAQAYQLTKTAIDSNHPITADKQDFLKLASTWEMTRFMAGSDDRGKLVREIMNPESVRPEDKLLVQTMVTTEEVEDFLRGSYERDGVLGSMDKFFGFRPESTIPPGLIKMIQVASRVTPQPPDSETMIGRFGEKLNPFYDPVKLRLHSIVTRVANVSAASTVTGRQVGVTRLTEGMTMTLHGFSGTSYQEAWMIGAPEAMQPHGLRTDEALHRDYLTRSLKDKLHVSGSSLFSKGGAPDIDTAMMMGRVNLVWISTPRQAADGKDGTPGKVHKEGGYIVQVKLPNGNTTTVFGRDNLLVFDWQDKTGKAVTNDYKIRQGAKLNNQSTSPLSGQSDKPVDTAVE